MKIRHITAAALLAFGIGAAPAANAAIISVPWGGPNDFNNAEFTFEPAAIDRVKKFIGITGDGFLHDHSAANGGTTGTLELRLDGAWTIIDTIFAGPGNFTPGVQISTFAMASFNHATLDGIRLTSSFANNVSYHNIGGDSFQFEVPEPGTLALLGLGLVGLGVARRRRAA